ncbi:MAG TPA: pyridoxamine 5'-phosphate oxidase family protein [Trebonia sp.]|nr:pyridoxamine 5'-phosphate oxidase family protein [Trebonia sp.]
MRKLATDRAGLEILHLGECFLLLGSVPLGRVGFVAGGEVVILPVNFVVDGQDVVFRTIEGSKLSAIEVGHYVGFEADSYDVATETGWSVAVNGLAEIVDSDAEEERLDNLGLSSWVGEGPDRVWVRIRPMSVTGRRIPSPEAEGTEEEDEADWPLTSPQTRP